MVQKQDGPVTAVLAGAGSRGRDAYGRYAEIFPDRLKFIAVADPDKQKLKRFQYIHDIPDAMAFTSWETLLDEERGKIADVAFICTPDRTHYDPAMQALKLDYDLVLEKPIAPTLAECRDIARLAMEKKRLVQVCHVLRFTGFWKKVKEILESGRLGNVVHYEHSENVAYWHFGHSFVRGAYKNKATSTPIILAKTCHDLDLMYWLLGEKANDVHSIGGVTHYKPENAPAGSPDRCTDGCPVAKECPWNAMSLYLDADPLIRTGLESQNRLIKGATRKILKNRKWINFFSLIDQRILKLKNWDEFPVTAITNDFTLEGKMKALREGPYGVCIYKAGNDVPDRQISTFTFPSGATGTLLMHGFAEFEGRELRIFGSRGVLRGTFRLSHQEITFTEFLKGEPELLFKEGIKFEAHGGGDFGIMDAFTSVMLGEKSVDEAGLTDVQGALESHYMGFAAEASRESNKVKNIIDYR